MAGLLHSSLAVALLAVLSLSGLPASLHAAELVMFESDLCEWCEAWHEEIGPIYPKTAEGRRAPLRTVDINDQRPPDLRTLEGVRFTPTFVLLDDGGREVGRINGYPGEDFFWGLLGTLIAKLPASTHNETTQASFKKVPHTPKYLGAFNTQGPNPMKWPRHGWVLSQAARDRQVIVSWRDRNERSFAFLLGPPNIS